MIDLAKPFVVSMYRNETIKNQQDKDYLQYNRRTNFVGFYASQGLINDCKIVLMLEGLEKVFEKTRPLLISMSKHAYEKTKLGVDKLCCSRM